MKRFNAALARVSGRSAEVARVKKKKKKKEKKNEGPPLLPAISTANILATIRVVIPADDAELNVKCVLMKFVVPRAYFHAPELTSTPVRAISLCRLLVLANLRIFRVW